MNGITDEQFKQFCGMTSELSPENLCCDGEISSGEANRRYREIMRRWKALEKKVGRKVSEAEIEREYIKNVWSKRPIRNG